jgi:O-antigen ligase
MGFLVFILLNATLFIRPTEIVPTLAGLPIYNTLILICLASCLGPVLAQLGTGALAERPISVCVLGVLATVILSNLARMDFLMARTEGFEFAKVVLYYLILLSVLNTPARLCRFLTWLAVFTVVLAGLSLLHYHGFVHISALEVLERLDAYDERTGEVIMVTQLRGTGIYNDPNDFCLILVVGIMDSLYHLCDRRAGPVRVLWLAPCGLCLYAVILTRSRGGFLGLLVSLLALFVARFGWRKAIPLATVFLPAMFLLSGGRQTKISTSEGTAQERIELWNAGLHRLARSPLTGIGAGRYAEENEWGLVAHNSYVHANVELGIVGGACFLGVFSVPLWSLRRLSPCEVEIHDPNLKTLRPFLVAMVAGYATGLISLSRCYIVPTYMLPGLVTAYLHVTAINPAKAPPKVGGQLIRNIIIINLSFLITIFIFIKFSLG